MGRSNAPESYRLSRDRKMGLRRSAPDAHFFVALHGDPGHLNSVVAALRDAVLLTAACIGAWQNGNPLTNFEALDATHFDAAAATGALARVDDGYPFVFHGRSIFVEFCVRLLLDDDRTLHPWVRCALEMHRALLI